MSHIWLITYYINEIEIEIIELEIEVQLSAEDC